MSNTTHTVKAKKTPKLTNYSTIEFNHKLFDRLHSLNTSFLFTFWNNNKLLRQRSGMTKRDQVKMLRVQGFVTTEKTILQGERHQMIRVSLTYLQAIAYHWSIPLLRMLAEDLSNVEHLPDH